MLGGSYAVTLNKPDIEILHIKKGLTNLTVFPFLSRTRIDFRPLDLIFISFHFISLIH